MSQTKIPLTNKQVKTLQGLAAREGVSQIDIIKRSTGKLPPISQIKEDAAKEQEVINPSGEVSETKPDDTQGAS